jgi:hypothetical protein
MAAGSEPSPAGSPGYPRPASTTYPRRYRQTDRTHTPSSPPAPARSQSDPDPVRQPDSNPTPHAPPARAFPALRPHPLRTLHPTFPLRRQRIPRRRSRRIRRIGTQLAPQRRVLQLTSLNPSNQTRNQRRQLVTPRTPRPSPLHTKIISQEPQRTHTRPTTNLLVNRTPEWTRPATGA